MSDDPKPILIGIDPAAGTDATAMVAVLQRMNGVELIHLNHNAKVSTAIELEIKHRLGRFQMSEMMRRVAEILDPMLERQLERSREWLERFEKERHERRRREQTLANKPPERRSSSSRKRKRLTVLRMVARPVQPKMMRFRRYRTDGADALAYGIQVQKDASVARIVT